LCRVRKGHARSIGRLNGTGFSCELLPAAAEGCKADDIFAAYALVDGFITLV
jgi:hypothetical protein